MLEALPVEILLQIKMENRFIHTIITYYDFLIVKYDENGIEKDSMKKQFGYRISEEGFTGLQIDPYGDVYIGGYGVGGIGGNNTSTTEENGFILKYKNKYGEKWETDDWHIKLNEEEQMVISYDNEDQMNAELLLDKHHNMHITTPTYR